MSSRALPPSQEQPLVVGLGGICLDFLAVLTTFPKPDDKTSCRSMKIQGGGDAANALTCLARLGVKARLISKIADDVHGKTLLEELRADDVDTSFLVVAKGGQTPFSIVMVDQSTRTRTCILPPGFPLMEPADVSSDLKSALKGANLVYFDARNTDTAILVGQEVAKQNIPILLDAETKRPGLDGLLDLSDYVVCSAKFPQVWTEAPSLPSALISMLLRLPKLKFAIVTLGEHGCLMLERSSEAESPLVGEEDADSLFHSLKQEIDDSVAIPMCIPSQVVKLKANGIGTLNGRLFVCTAERIPPSEVVDTTGAGDAFIGAILYALCTNMPPETMLPFAATVAAAGCKALGARTGLPYRTHTCLAPFLGQTDDSAKPNEERLSHNDQIMSHVDMVPLPVGPEGVAVPSDPRIDGIVQVLETLSNIIGQQAQNQAAATAATTAAANAVAAVSTAPAEVQPIGERAAAFGSQFKSNRDGNRFGEKPMTERKYPIRPNRGIGKPAPNLNKVCRICRRKHGPIPCPGRTGACYGCGQHGHQVRNCPRKHMHHYRR